MALATPITSDEILREDGVAAAFAEFAEEVKAGEDALHAVLAEADPGQSWTIRGLREAAAEGRRSTVMQVALLGLESEGAIKVDYASSTVKALS